MSVNTALQGVSGRTRPDEGPAVLLSQLGALGLLPLVQRRPDGLRGNGLGLAASVRQLSTSRAALHRLCDRLRCLLMGGTPVTLCLRDAGACSSRRIERVLRLVHRATAAPCVDRGQLGLMIEAGAWPLPAFLLMSKVLLGNGPRYLCLGEAELGRRGLTDIAAACAWRTLYQQRLQRGRIKAVYRSDARNPCPLLSDEPCDAVCGQAGLPLPASAAALQINVNLCRFADCRGALRQPRLLLSLTRGLRVADKLFDYLCWTDPRQRRDAMQNRRILFDLQGIGDLVRLRGEDPGSVACLQGLDGLLAAIHRCLWRESARLAGHRGVLPALGNKDPSRGLPAGEQRQRWHQHWQAAVREQAVRHRNLVVLSPAALLPQSGAVPTAHFNLLPLLARADLCGPPSAPCGPDWTIKEFKDFHSRAWTVLQRLEAASFIAAGV